MSGADVVFVIEEGSCLRYVAVTLTSTWRTKSVCVLAYRFDYEEISSVQKWTYYSGI